MVLLAALAYCYIAGTIVFSVTFDPQKPKDRAFKNYDSKPNVDEAAEKVKQNDNAWFDSAAKDVSITARDGTTLCGKFFEACASGRENSSGRGTIICMHGYRSTVYQMAAAARHWIQAGYNVLVPWQRCHGASGGKYHGMGYLEHFDALDWAAWIAGQDSGGKTAGGKTADADIVFYGISMGAATVMMASGDSGVSALPVKALIADCGFASITAQLTQSVKKQVPGAFAVIAMTSLITKIRAGFFLGQGDCMKFVRNASMPKLFIHGTADDFVPFYMLQQLYDAAREPKQKLEVQGAGHTKSCIVQSELYWSAIDSFLREKSFLDGA